MARALWSTRVAGGRRRGDRRRHVVGVREPDRGATREGATQRSADPKRRRDTGACSAGRWGGRDRLDREVRRGPFDVAGRAREVTEVADAAPRVPELPSASPAGHWVCDRVVVALPVASVGRRSGEAEGPRRQHRIRGEHGEPRIICAVHEDAAGGGGRQGRRPAVDDRVGLPIAIQLIPKQVRRHDDRRSEFGKDLAQRDLVDLEDAGPRAELARPQVAAQIRRAHQ